MLVTAVQCASTIRRACVWMLCRTASMASSAMRIDFSISMMRGMFTMYRSDGLAVQRVQDLPGAHSTSPVPLTPLRGTVTCHWRFFDMRGLYLYRLDVCAVRLRAASENHFKF